MSYAEAIEFLYSLRLFGAKFGLENPLRLAELAGNPQRQLRLIHVAGTNGKGSTCAMLESVYRAAGLKTGLFTSPHLISFCERIQVDRVAVSEADIVRLVSEIQPLLATFSGEAHPTFFETITIMALKYFAEQQCDIVIWETGLGGRLDATNIVTPLVSVITNVQRDHEQWLGNTLAEIAFEKAGIIKPGIRVITGADAPEALAVIQRVALERSAALISAAKVFAGTLPLAGEHQRKNAMIALATIQTLQNVLPISPEAIRKGFKTVSWPGRLQLIKTQRQNILLDGAHNVDGASALRKSMPEIFPKGPDALILGMLRDKNCGEICHILAPLALQIFVTPVQSDRTAGPAALGEFCASANPAAAIVVCTSLPDALKRASPARSILITGSLYLIGEALELLQKEAPKISERALNDWSATSREQCG